MTGFDPEDKLHGVLNHEYDLDKNIPKLEILLKKLKINVMLADLQNIYDESKFKLMNDIL